MQEKIEEIFGKIPSLLAFFKDYQREQVRAKNGIFREGVTEEAVAARNEALLQVAQSITGKEVQLLYYLRNTDGVDIDVLLRTIKKAYHAQCTFKNELDGGTREDILQLTKKKGDR